MCFVRIYGVIVSSHAPVRGHHSGFIVEGKL